MKNIAPKSPGIEVNTDTGEVTITPPAYENAGEDTDLASYTISYKDASGAEKTVTATRTVDETSGKTTWSSDDATVDENTGVITLKVEDIEVGGTITAKAKDNGGLIPDEEPPLDSDPATKTLDIATVSYDVNGGTGEMDSRTLNQGSKYKILDNGFTAPEGHEFDFWQVGGEKKTPGDEITIGDDDIVIKAIWKTTPTDPKKPDTPDDANTPKDTPDDAATPTPKPTPQEPEPTGSSDQPQPTDTVPEPETSNPDVPEDPHSPGNWISPDPSDDWRNQTPLEGQKTPGSIQVIQQQSAPGAAPAPTASNAAPTSTEKEAKGLPRTGENPSLLVQSLAILLAAGGALALIQQRKIRIRR